MGELERLAERIRSELRELEQVLGRVQMAWDRAQRSGDDFYLDSVALNLHGFYSGLERIFERVAAVLDDSFPQGANWHQSLLEQMAGEVEGVRPAVISRNSRARLDEYRGFRHVVRNVYAFEFDPEKLETLVEGASTTFAQVHSELSAFAAFLEEVER